jgi:hypothetical protein
VFRGRQNKRIDTHRKTNPTRKMLKRHLMIATRETRQVVMKVTNITQTPYALPSLVVYENMN